MSEEPYALIGTCEICGAVNAIDLDGTEVREKDLQAPNRKVTRVTTDTARTRASELRPCAHGEEIAKLRELVQRWQCATGYNQPSAAHVGIPALRNDHKRLLEENEKLKRLAYAPADGSPWQTICEMWAKKYDAAERAMKENLDRAVHAESTNEEALSKLRGEWQKATGYDTPAVVGTVLTMLKNDLNALQYQRAVEKDDSYPPDIERALDAKAAVIREHMLGVEIKDLRCSLETARNELNRIHEQNKKLISVVEMHDEILEERDNRVRELRSENAQLRDAIAQLGTAAYNKRRAVFREVNKPKETHES